MVRVGHFALESKGETEVEYSLTKFAALLAAGFMAGCANNPVYESRYPWEAGWREGVVSGIGEDDEFRRKYAQRCKAEAALPSTVRFATVRWTQMGKPKWQTVTVPKDSPLKVGDLVHVKILDCAGQAIPRTAQKKSAAAENETQALMPTGAWGLAPAHDSEA